MTSRVGKCSVKLMSLPLKPVSISCHKHAGVGLLLAQVRWGRLEVHARPTPWKRSHPCIWKVDTYLHRHISFLCRRETQEEETVGPDSFITSPQKYRWIQWWKSVLRNVRKILTSIHQSDDAVSKLNAGLTLQALVKQGSFWTTQTIRHAEASK